MFAASGTKALHPNKGGHVTAIEYSHIKITTIFAPRLLSLYAENGLHTRKYLSNANADIVVMALMPKRKCIELA